MLIYKCWLFRCVDYYGNGKKYSIFQFSCPPTLEFDEELSICSKPVKSCTRCNLISESSIAISQLSNQNMLSSEVVSTSDLPSTSTSAVIWTDFLAAPSTVVPTTPSHNSASTQSSLEIGIDSQNPTKDVDPTETLSMDCTPNKFYRLPDNCNRFYQCFQRSISVFSCAPGLIFDEKRARCTLPDETSCDQQLNEPVEELSKFFEIKCSGVMLRYPLDCRRFYQCYSNGDTKSLLFFTCSAGLIFDEKSSQCLLPYETSPCFAVDSSTESSSFVNHLQRLFYSSPNKFAISL